MSNPTSLFYWNDRLALTEPRCLVLGWDITAAKTVSQVPVGRPVLETFDALTQAQIDAFLTDADVTSSSEFTLAQFDATSMGVDAFGAIINMREQAAKALWIDLTCHLVTGTDGVVRNVEVATDLSDSTLANNVEFEVSSAGNMAFKATVTGLDAATDGFIEAKLYWQAN